MNNLTDLKLKNLIKKGEAIAISDGGGLTFTLSKEGAKRGQGSWILRYTFNGKKKELTLAKYPAISLKDARLMAETERTRIAKGIDVAQVKQENKREESKVYNFEVVTQTWLKAKILASDIKHKNIPQRVISHNLLPVFTGRDIRTITLEMM